MVRISHRTALAIAETSRALIECGQWHFPSRDALHTLELCETNLAQASEPWARIIISGQALRLANHAQQARDNGELDNLGFDISMLMTPEAYENTFGADASTLTAVYPIAA